MKYMKLDDSQRQELLESLAGMTSFLHEAFGSLSVEESSRPGPDGSFSPVEQVWHLADLEREGFGTRLDRLQAENRPHLPDFDGDRIARERNYRARSLRDGLSAFAMARKANLDTLQLLPWEAWTRSGTQEGVGPVSLCDMPVFMHQHDQAHVAEISAWKEAYGQRSDA